MHNFAILYHTQKKYKESRDLYEECLQRRTKVLGELHIDTISTTHCLAKLYEDTMGVSGSTGDCVDGGRNESSMVVSYQQVHNMYRKCYSRRREVLGSTHPDTVQAFDDMQNASRVTAEATNQQQQNV